MEQKRNLELVQLMLPADANPQGNVHGGTILKLMDTAAGMCAQRYCRTSVVVASTDRIDFLRPVYIGDLIAVRATITCVGKRSIEVRIEVQAETPLTGEIRHVSSTYMTVVSLEGPVPEPVDLSIEEKAEFIRGRFRMEYRRKTRPVKQ